MGADCDTIVVELVEHGNVAKYAISYDMNLSGTKVLDLTNPEVAYNVIKFQSYRGEEMNFVIYSDFDNIL